MVAWFNANQGFAMASLTLAYVICTLCLVWFGYRQTRIAIWLEQQRSRPFIVFDLEFKRYCVHAVLKNTGLSAAHNVAVEVTPRLTRSAGGQVYESALTSTKIAFITPGREFWDMLDSAPTFFKHFPELKFEARLQYYDSSGCKYEESCPIDISFARDLEFFSEPDLARELKAIRAELHELVRQGAS